MLTLQDLLTARFDAVRQDLEGVLELLDDNDLDWSPQEGMLTIRGQLQEVADKEVETVGWLATGTWPDDHEGAFGPEESLVAIRMRLAEIRADTLALVESLDEQGLRRQVPNPGRWWEGLRLSVCPFDEILRNVAAHEWFHTGQIITYLGARGQDPYPR